MGPDAPDLEERVSRRLTTLGLAVTEMNVAIGATLRPDTVATLTLKNSPEASRQPTAELPTISVDAREPALGSAADRTHTPDLSILSTLGEGGMGRVHLARQRSLERDVAVKTLKEAAPAHAAAALLSEARLMGSLEHPGVIPVHALGVSAEGRPLLVMKRVDGVDFGQLLDDDAHPLWNTRSETSSGRLVAKLEVLIRVCETLEFAHRRGVLHRDIKPENVMIGEFGEVYLLDWGIAMALGDSAAETSRNVLVGTPAYMAPEMALGGPVDARTDVYLLGATLHQILTLSYRHDGRSLAEVLVKAALSEPVSYAASIPEALADLANRATAPDPATRPPSALAFRQEITAYLGVRSAAALCDAAEARLSVLRRALADAPDGAPPADLAAAYRAGNEARFGFTQCLADRSDHAPARAGLDDCLGALAELELRQGHADAAAALLDELAEPPPALLARVSAIRDDAKTARRETERLRALAHDLDPGVAARPRSAALVLLGALVGMIALFTMVVGGGPKTFSLERLIEVNLAIAFVALIVLWGSRRFILGTSFNRRMVGLLAVAIAGSLLNRVGALGTEMTVAEVVFRDTLLFAAVLSAAAITMLSSLWFCVGLLAVTLAAMHFDPGHAILYFGASSVTAVFLISYLLWRRRAA